MISLLAIALLINENSALTGYASNYGDGNPYGNACGYKGTSDAFDNWAYAAIGDTRFDSGYGCGKCWKVRCTGAYGYNPTCSCDTTKWLVIQSLDECSECTGNHAFDLTAKAMDYFTGNRGMTGTCGLLSVEYERVDCGKNDVGGFTVSGNLKIRTKSGTSAYWYGVHLDNIGGDGAVKKIVLKSTGKSATSTCDKSQGSSFWICNGGYPLQFPLSVTLTSESGDTISCTNCIGSAAADYSWDFGSNFGSSGGSSPSSPVSSPTQRPTSRPTNRPTSGSSPTTPPVSSGGGSGTIRIKQNQGVSQWWYAVEFPDGNIDSVQTIEFRDQKHTSWITGEKLNWGAYTFAHGGTAFSGRQNFRIKLKGASKSKASWGVFSGISPNSIATLNTASAYTEEDTIGGSGLTSAGLAAIIIVALLLILCIGGGVYYYKKHWNRNKGEASFKTTDADTPQSTKGSNNDNEAEIEVEMNVEYTNETTR